jgi:hypothetical protein
MDVPQVYDRQGQEQDWDWLIASFGAISLERAKAPAGVSQVYRIVKLREVEGPAVEVVHLDDRDGHPLEGIRVVRHWPGAPLLPGWPPPTSRWRDRGVFGGTNVNGDIGFGMGHGDYYFPPNGGASAVWVAEAAGPSDFIAGLGMLGGTNHRHLDVYFQLKDLDVPPPAPPEPSPEPPSPPPAPPVPDPEPPPARPEEGDNWVRLFRRLDRITELLEKMSS